MKLVAIVSLALCAMCQAHMGMTLAGVPAREKAKNGDNYRSPHGTKICQGTPRIGVQKTVATGATMKGVMSGGAAHGGGHCSMIVSVDEKKWYKIGDYKDCTTKGGLQFVMPKGVPKKCSEGQGCTFGWLWTPIFSGTCEIYMNCYQIKVTGAMGGIETTENREITLPIGKCVRPNSKTKYTTMFGFIIGATAKDPYTGGVTAAPTTTKPGQVTTTPEDHSPITISPDTNSPTCERGQLLLSTGLPKTHTVAVVNCGYQSEFTEPDKKKADEDDKCKKANTLSLISQLYDLQCSGRGCNNWDVIYNLNKCSDTSIVHSCANGNKPACMAGTPGQICVGQVLKLPQSECGEAPCGADGDWSVKKQKCLCETNFYGAQCQFKRGGGSIYDKDGNITDMGTTATLSWGMGLCFGVVRALLF